MSLVDNLNTDTIECIIVNIEDKVREIAISEFDFIKSAFLHDSKNS